MRNLALKLSLVVVKLSRFPSNLCSPWRFYWQSTINCCIFHLSRQAFVPLMSQDTTYTKASWPRRHIKPIPFTFTAVSWHSCLSGSASASELWSSLICLCLQYTGQQINKGRLHSPCNSAQPQLNIRKQKRGMSLYLFVVLLSDVQRPTFHGCLKVHITVGSC